MTLGRHDCGSWDAAIRYEWLVTNGLGGYACGTVAGANTRRYHAFLVASLNPPVQRTVLVSKMEVSVRYLGRLYHLAANEFAGGAVDPRGFIHIESFAVEDGIPTWRYAIGDALLEQRVFMAQFVNASYLRLDLKRASAPMGVEVKPLLTYRDHHSQNRGAQPFEVHATSTGCTVQAPSSACGVALAISSGCFKATPQWYWNFFHREEAARGLDALEDLFLPGLFSADITADGHLTVSANAGSANADASPPAAQEIAADRIAGARQRKAALPRSAPQWIQTLGVASDQFIVRRGASGDGATSIVAGYPWFSDWGRDTMISLPGLATALRRYEVTAGILRTYARFVDRGMLPNRFPDSGEQAEYNTADATLWMFHALDDYLAAHADPQLSSDLFPTLMAIIRAHVQGTRYGIRVDPDDGLLRVGEPGVQLTWMDAKQGDRLFTPRAGKPVEINALWLNALDVAVRLAGRLRNPAEKRYCQGLLTQASAGFGRFWNEEQSGLDDVIDIEGGTGRDPTLRPNQIFAVSLPYTTLSAPQMRAVVDRCGRELVTSYGLRSLRVDDPAYRGTYAGNPWQRDAAYHQGTAWAWLLGPFARAHYRVYDDPRAAQSFLDPMEQHLAGACVGSLSEIFDGDAPHTARGCFAQAWSVAEILRSWIYLERKISRS